MIAALIPTLALLAAAPAPGRGERAPTGGQLLEEASGELEKLRRALTEVLARVEDARDEKDLVKLLCADEKLARIKSLVSVAERAETALAEAVANRDDGAATEFSKISIARRKADAVRAEAAGCIGQLAFEVAGSTSVVVQEPGDLPRIGEERSRADDPELRLDDRLPTGDAARSAATGR